MPAFIGHGTEITIGGVDLLGCFQTGIEQAADNIDVTAFDTPNKYRAYIQGLKDGGDIPFECNFDGADAGQQALSAAFQSGATVAIVVTMPDGTAFSFSGQVVRDAIGDPVGDKITRTFALRTIGPITETAPTP